MIVSYIFFFLFIILFFIIIVNFNSCMFSYFTYCSLFKNVLYNKKKKKSQCGERVTSGGE